MSFTAYDAATDTIDRSRNLLRAARPHRLLQNRKTKKIVSRPSTVPTEGRSDMRRLSIVMAVAALDTYMHRLIVERVFSHSELPKKLSRLDINFEALLAQADATGAAARAEPSKPRPRVGVKRQLQDRLLRETFQSSRAISDALAMAGKPKKWEAIGLKMSPVLKPEELMERLDEIVRRRNKIVHEGDYERLQKPQKAKLNTLSLAEARGDIDFIGELIDAIHDVVS